MIASLLKTTLLGTVDPLDINPKGKDPHQFSLFPIKVSAFNFYHHIVVPDGEQGVNSNETLIQKNAIISQLMNGLKAHLLNCCKANCWKVGRLKDRWFKT